MSIVSLHVLAMCAPLPGTGACVGIGAVTAGGIAPTLFAMIVLAAVPSSGWSQQGARVLGVHGPGDTSAPGHPQSVATTTDGDPDGAGA